MQERKNYVVQLTEEELTALQVLGFNPIQADFNKAVNTLNTRVVCIKSMSQGFTKGKIYEIVDGDVRDDSDNLRTNVSSVHELRDYFRTIADFIEVIEEEEEKGDDSVPFLTTKVICVDAKSAYWTAGKIYNVQCGVIVDDEGDSRTTLTTSVEALNQYLSNGAEFIEVCE